MGIGHDTVPKKIHLVLLRIMMPMLMATMMPIQNKEVERNWMNKTVEPNEEGLY